MEKVLLLRIVCLVKLAPVCMNIIADGFLK